jgi:hypothetical protein
MIDPAGDACAPGVLVMGHLGRSLHRKQVKQARISPQRHEDTEKALVRFARYMNGHKHEVPKSLLLRVFVSLW